MAQPSFFAARRRQLRAGELVYLFLLVGLMLPLLAGLEARDAAVRRPGPD